MIGIIVATTMNGVIGEDGKIPFNYPEDLKHFKRTTLNSVVIMGRKTFEGIGGPLPQRENIVITSKTDINGVTCLASVKDAIDREKNISRDTHKDIWLIGGASIYEEGMLYADKIILTLVPIYNNKGTIKFPWVNPTIFQYKNIYPLSIGSELMIIEYNRIVNDIH